MKKSLYKWLFRLLYGLFFLWVGFLILIGAVFIRLQSQPFDLTPYLPQLESFLAVNGHTLHFERALLSFKGGLVVQGRGAVLLDQRTGAPVLRLGAVRLVFSNHHLVLGQPALKHIALDEVSFPAVRQPDGTLEIAGFVVRGSAAASDTAAPDIVRSLQQASFPGPYRVLKTVDISHLALLFDDVKEGARWRLNDASLHFSKHVDEGEMLQASGLLQRIPMTSSATAASPTFPSTPVPVDIFAKHEPKAPQLLVKATLKNTTTDWLKSYVKDDLRDLFSAKGDLTLGSVIGLHNRLIEQSFLLDLHDGFVFVPAAYTQPFRFKTLDVSGRYTESGGGTLLIESAHVLDENGLQATLEGKISHIHDRMYADVQGTADTAKLSMILPYLPDKHIQGTVDWLRTYVRAGDVRSLRLRYAGFPADMPGCYKSCGFDGHFAFSNATIGFLENVPAATAVSGTFEMKADAIVVKSAGATARLAGAEVKDLTARITDLFRPEPHIFPTLLLTGTTAGSAAQAVTLAQQIVASPEKPKEPWVKGLQGGQVSHVSLTIPLQPDLKPENIGFLVETDLTRTRLPLPVERLKDVVFEAPLSSLSVSSQKLIYQAPKALLNGRTPARVRWEEDVTHFGEATALDIRTALPFETLKRYAASVPVTGRGDVPFSLVLRPVSGTLGASTFRFDGDFGTASLTAAAVAFDKKRGDTLKLSLAGDLRKAADDFVLRTVSAVGTGVNLRGNFAQKGEGVGGMTAHFSPFVMGRTRLDTVDVRKGTVSLKGAALDASRFLSWSAQKDKLALPPQGGAGGPDGDAGATKNAGAVSGQGRGKNQANAPLAEGWSSGSLKASLGWVYLQDGEFSNVSADLKRKGGKWQTGTLSAHVPPAARNAAGGQVSVVFKPVGNERAVTFKAQPAGEVLRSLGVYPNFRKGTLQADFFLSNTQEGVGRGTVHLSDVNMVGAPVMARLLSLVSLPELLRGEAGIRFDAVTLPVTFTSDYITVRDASMSGPSIGLRYAGILERKTGGLNFRGYLLPVEGLNTLIGKIPLLGRLITGSQEGVLAAHFTVRGTTQDPDVWANPFSLVTPGLIKDIFNALTGEDAAPSAPPPADIRKE